MNLFQILPIALRALSLNKVRSTLTALGVVFGVAAVVAMLSIGEGARRESIEQVELLGANTIVIKNSTGWQPFSSDGLVMCDGEAIGSLNDVVAWAGLRRYKDRTVARLGKKFKAEVVATTPSYATVVDLGLDRGRYFDDFEYVRGAHVCILGSTLKRGLFGFEDAIGEDVKIGDTYFTVIGVAEYKRIGRSRISGLKIPHYNNEIFVPLTLADYFEGEEQHRPRSPECLDEIWVKVATSRQVVTVARLLERLLSRLHAEQDDFTIVVPQSLLAQTQRTQRTFNIVMGAIAGISLLVGGIGIMNIMLATVLERRFEIGVRRAAGATARVVMLQFLLEAMLISLVGCIVGILLGTVIATAVAHYAGWRTAINFIHVIAAVGVAAGVGIASGYYPALRAARTDPGEALRYE
ncbi:MAG TPA: FtsX-like permease family protein [Firmicutes bacterium]|nr:FtsX-like permease family protein [Bacillota bacterium]